MNYDTWKSTDVHSERGEYIRPDSEQDVLRYALPKYRLHVSYDRWLNQTRARLMVQRAPRADWRTLDEQVVGGSSEALAVFWLRMNRRQSRGAM